MKKKLYLILNIIIFTVITNTIAANQNIYFNEGKKLFDSKKYEEARIKFEKDIVFNPKNFNSYLYLAKIFNQEKKSYLEKNNLNTVISLDPKNEEAIYYLALISIEESNFDKANEYIEKLKITCSKLCSKDKSLKKKLNDLIKK